MIPKITRFVHPIHWASPLFFLPKPEITKEWKHLKIFASLFCHTEDCYDSHQAQALALVWARTLILNSCESEVLIANNNTCLKSEASNCPKKLELFNYPLTWMASTALITEESKSCKHRKCGRWYDRNGN